MTSSLSHPAWRLLTNGDIHTLDPRQPRARSILVANERIAAVFEEPYPDLWIPDSLIDVVNLGGRTVFPGFTDSHIHLIDWGISLGRAELGPSRSAEEAVELLRAHVAKEPPAPGEWIIGQGWSHNNWRTATLPAGAAPLDEHFPATPVVLHSKCGHLAWVNSAALRAAEITAATPDPPGGRVDRDPQTGAPTGILKENAIGLLDRAIQAPDRPALRRALDRATRAAHEQGIVAVHAVEPVEFFRVMQEARAHGELGLRIAYYLPRSAMDSAIQAGIRSGLGDARLSFQGIKMFVDGSLGGRTAWMLAPLVGEPDNTGIPVTCGEELREAVRKANTNGLSCAIHAIGDRAIRDVVDAYEAAAAALADRPGDRARLRNRIEHCQTVDAADFARIGRLGISACMQPVHLFGDWRAADRFLGPERSMHTYALRSLARAGARLAFGSDAPVETVHIGSGLCAAVWRRDAEGLPKAGWNMEEAVTMDEALRAYCLAGPEITLDENDRGALSPGKRADLAVLGADPYSATPEQLIALRVTATMIDGEWVHGEDEIRG